MNRDQAIHETVSRAYTRALGDRRQGQTRLPSAGCCSGATATAATPPTAATIPTSQTAALAGYQGLAHAPEDAVANAFGCGDPVAIAEVQPGMTVLDLGSGAGLDIILAARRVGPDGRVIGVDMTDAMIDRARQNIAEAGLDNVEVRKGLIEDLPVEDSSIDMVLSNCVINLSPDKPRVFTEIARVLKPGGRMLVADIVVDDLPEAVRANEAVYCGCIGGAISEASYLDGLRNAGLDDVQVRTRFTYGASQLAYLFGDGLHGEDGGSCCGVGPHGDADIADLAPKLEGCVHSIQVSGRRA